MPLKQYGVLKARPLARRVSSEKYQHYHLHLDADGIHHRASVCVRSALEPSAMEYCIRPDFRHRITPLLSCLTPGYHELPRHPGSLALDYIRDGELVDRNEFLTLPCSGPGCGEDLDKVLDGVICEALDDPESWVYAFGEPWEMQGSDRFFRFFPSRGMHDIHMNQGNAPIYWEQDGAWQDGALLIERPRLNRWIGVFLKFQSQTWHTEDDTGHARLANFMHHGDGVPIGHGGARRPEGMVRIVAARVQPPLTHAARHDSRHGRRGRSETVTLLNVCPTPVDLNHWSLVNRDKRSWRLHGTLAPGEVREIPLGKAMILGPQGGTIALLNSRGVKIHGVTYTAEQACVAGWKINF